jgi:XRE family transcriptional regulator, regulator of sulfur utilization
MLMLTARDLAVASIAVVTTVVVSQFTAVGFGAVQSSATPPAAAASSKAADTTLMKSAVFQWDSFTPTSTNVGAVRRLFRAPTATLDELESHVTTLNPHTASHDPHKHVNEELIILKDGALEAYVNGEWVSVHPHSIIFNASNILHGVRNPGDTPATYYVLNWSSPGTLKKETAAAR